MDNTGLPKFAFLLNLAREMLLCQERLLGSHLALAIEADLHLVDLTSGAVRLIPDSRFYSDLGLLKGRIEEVRKYSERLVKQWPEKTDLA